MVNYVFTKRNVLILFDVYVLLTLNISKRDSNYDIAIDVFKEIV